jgi:hypothetical protein
MKRWMQKAYNRKEWAYVLRGAKVLRELYSQGVKIRRNFPIGNIIWAVEYFHFAVSKTYVI